MKTVLVYCLSANCHPYPMLTKASMDTWDSVGIHGVETLYFVGGKPVMTHPQVLSFDAADNYNGMGYKCLLAYRWALDNLKWDYMARINSSCYTRKARLLEAVQSLPDTGVFRGVKATEIHGREYLWGGAQYIMSRDVVQAFVDHAAEWDHKDMEDVAMSLLAAKLGIRLDEKGFSCSINRNGPNWLCVAYGDGKQYGSVFHSMEGMKQYEEQYFVRVKQDMKRDQDVKIMKELHELSY